MLYLLFTALKFYNEETIAAVLENNKMHCNFKNVNLGKNDWDKNQQFFIESQNIWLTF